MLVCSFGKRFIILGFLTKNICKLLNSSTKVCTKVFKTNSCVLNSNVYIDNIKKLLGILRKYIFNRGNYKSQE